MSPTRFVVVGINRTGSSWLCQLLDAHPSILCHGELFNSNGIGFTPAFRIASTRAQAWTVEARDADPRGFLADIVADGGGVAAVGFKLFWWQQQQLFPELLADRDVAKVMIRRENRIHVFLSRKRSEALGQWHEVDYDGMQMSLDPQELLAFTARYNRLYTEFDRACAGSRVHRVSYEELLADTRRVDRVVEFLGIAPTEAPLRAWIRRQSRDLLRDAITNFDELSQAVAGTDLEPELSE
jgi:LPS sulfotransferase NodH